MVQLFILITIIMFFLAMIFAAWLNNLLVKVEKANKYLSIYISYGLPIEIGIYITCILFILLLFMRYSEVYYSWCSIFAICIGSTFYISLKHDIYTALKIYTISFGLSSLLWKIINIYADASEIYYFFYGA